MIRGLELPDQPAGLEVEGRQGVDEGFVRLGPGHADLVGRAVAERHVDLAQTLVGRELGPGHRRVRLVEFARFERRGVVGLAGVELPHDRAGAHVVGADRSRRVGLVVIVGDGAAEDHEVPGHQRRRGLLVGRPLQAGHLRLQIDRAVGAEAPARGAGIGVQGVELGVHRGRDDPARAFGDGRRGRLGGGRIGLGRRHVTGRVVVGHAAAGLVLVLGVPLHLGIEGPDQLAGLRLQRLDDAVRGAEIQQPVHFDGRRLEGVFLRILAVALAQVAGMVLPGDLEGPDVAGIDVLQRRVALAQIGAAIRDPVVGRIGHAARVDGGVAGLRDLRQAALRLHRIDEPSRDTQDRQERHDGAQGQRAVPQARRPGVVRCIPQAPRHEGQGQQQAEEQDQRAARDPLPLVEADLLDRPGEGGRQGERVEPEPALAAPGELDPGSEQAEADPDVERRSADRRKLVSEADQG